MKRAASVYQNLIKGIKLHFYGNVSISLFELRGTLEESLIKFLKYFLTLTMYSNSSIVAQAYDKVF